MKILYLVHFNAPMGGLHENLYSSALFMKKNGHDVYVVLKAGPLEERLSLNGINTIVVDYEYMSVTLQAIRNINVHFNIIHTHPGPSRKAALHYSREVNVPLIITFHGMWADSLNLYSDRINSIICVSEGVKDFIKSQAPGNAEKYSVIHNGFDSTLFDKPKYYEKENNANTLRIGFITRLDKDKQFILDIFLIALKHLKKNTNYSITFDIIGNGTLKDKFINECETILKDSDHKINFMGWLMDYELKEAYLNCDIIMAPGRSAIESMACGKPTIAVGSKKYIGLIKHDNWRLALYNNFGGYGKKFNDYSSGSVESDLDLLLDNKDNIILLGKFGNRISEIFYDSELINKKLAELYKFILYEQQLEYISI